MNESQLKQRELLGLPPEVPVVRVVAIHAEGSSVRDVIAKLWVLLPTIQVMCRKLFIRSARLAFPAIPFEHAISPPLVPGGMMVPVKSFGFSRRVNLPALAAENLFGGRRNVPCFASSADLRFEKIRSTPVGFCSRPALLRVDQRREAHSGASFATANVLLLPTLDRGTTDDTHPAGRAPIIQMTKGYMSDSAYSTDSLSCDLPACPRGPSFAGRNFEVGFRASYA
jgi:hypothetical protein